MRKICIFFYLFLFCTGVFANTIEKKTKNLESNKRIEQELSKKLEDLAKDILNGERVLKDLAAQIKNLNDQTTRLQARAKAQNRELNSLNNQNANLLKNKTHIQRQLIGLIAKDFAYDLPISQGYVESEESFIVFEILGVLDKILNDEFFKLSKNYESVSKLINDKHKQIQKINKDLKEYKDQLARLQTLRQNQLAQTNKQKRDRAIYTKKLKDLQAQQNELRRTLNQLKIIDTKEKGARSKDSDAKIARNNQQIRQIGSSYQGGSTKRYTGKKTIAPLDSFTVKQKFGNYIDPIYNIKIFNENVVLRSNKSNAVVKSVLDGKIVFAKDTSMLARVVIVEHNNGIHTIYAHLDKIAPNIRVGKNVKKGAVIGRIKNDLTFEVTQKNFHINPLEFISLN